MTANTDVLEQAAHRPPTTQGLGPTKSEVLIGSATLRPIFPMQKPLHVSSVAVPTYLVAQNNRMYSLTVLLEVAVRHLWATAKVSPLSLSYWTLGSRI